MQIKEKQQLVNVHSKIQKEIVSRGHNGGKSCEGWRVLAIRTEGQEDREANRTKEWLVKLRDSVE